MHRLLDIRERVGKAEELYDIIGAVRAMAAVRVRQAQEGLEAVHAYADITARALSTALALLAVPPSRSTVPAGPRLVVVFGAEHGFVGPYNDILLDATAAELDGAMTEVAVVGARTAAMAEERRMALQWTLAAPTHGHAVEAVVGEIFDRVYQAFARPRSGQQAVRRVDVLYAPYAPGPAITPLRRTLLPLALTGFAGAVGPSMPPVHHLPAEELAEHFIDDYVLGELAQVAMEAFASENSARLLSMNQAHRNIEGRLDELRGLAHRLRQDEITTEILDVVVGAEAVAKGWSRSNHEQEKPGGRAERGYANARIKPKEQGARGFHGSRIGGHSARRKT